MMKSQTLHLKKFNRTFPESYRRSALQRYFFGKFKLYI